MRIFLFFVLVFIGCIESPKMLPGSTGKHSEVVFVAEDNLWKNRADSLVKSIFGTPVQAINQSESLFRIIQVNHSEFKSILKRHKNVVIVSEGGKKAVQKNKWASGQLVAQLNWDSDLQKLLKELISLRKTFVAKELKSIKRAFAKTSQKNIEKIHLSNFGTEIIIPKEYQIVMNESSFFWANYDPKKSDEIKNIFTFSFVPKTSNLQAEVLNKTDSVFSKYFIGEKPGSYVRIEPGYPPYYFENTYRGLWKLENGFMGGPFLIKTHIGNNEIVVSVGLVFAPQSRKRRYIKEFEAIL